MKIKEGEEATCCDCGSNVYADLGAYCERCGDFVCDDCAVENALCETCAIEYREEMIHMGFWKDGRWTDKGIREMTK